MKFLEVMRVQLGPIKVTGGYRANVGGRKEVAEGSLLFIGIQPKTLFSVTKNEFRPLKASAAADCDGAVHSLG